MKLDDNITKLKNIGETRALAFKALSIYTIGDLITHYPRDYEDRSKITDITEIELDEKYVIKATFYKECEVLRARGMIITKGFVKDKTGTLEIVWFNQPYLKNTFKAGSDVYFFIGKVSEKNGKKQMISPDFEKESEISLNASRIVPIYPATNGLTQKLLRKTIADSLNQISEEYEDFLADDILKKYDLCAKSYAVKNIHFPENNEAFFKARKRLVFEEFFVLLLALLKIKGVSKDEATSVFINNNFDTNINFGYELTNAQKKVISEIKHDFKAGHAMCRLVQGDVGSGKTAVSLIAAYLAIKSGYQAAIMAPTEVLARQHFEGFAEIFKPLGVNTVMLSGSMKKKDKDFALAEIASGDAQMIVGTHSLIQDRVEFENLGLVVTDEQHRFGVLQRKTFSKKGEFPHVLVMSATPIPRTLALVLYGDLDISIINEMPPGRQKIETFAVNSSYRNRIFEFIKKEVDAGSQAYIICSSIENDTENIKSVLNYTEEIKQSGLNGYSVACLHGRMKQSEKEEIMDKFARNEISVLVATTVVEVGVNVPNATIMVIENAERFGLSQLHQLRGRVGRGKKQSYCVLVSDSKGETTKKRLKAMVDTTDGFLLSELDLKLRGTGDFFGTRQHGLIELKIGNLYKDTKELAIAQELAKEMALKGIEGNEKLVGTVKSLMDKLTKS
ncbi:MAG: ATP-dependent DNA helicase RecG [Defluviitaleaceae bacterium]|nr:ATP-dependent DNA helicase RecG [Defluviitaleaceae bacterium]